MRFDKMTAEQHMTQAAKLRKRARWGLPVMGLGTDRQAILQQAQLHAQAALVAQGKSPEPA